MVKHSMKIYGGALGEVLERVVEKCIRIAGEQNPTLTPKVESLINSWKTYLNYLKQMPEDRDVVDLLERELIKHVKHVVDNMTDEELCNLLISMLFHITLDDHN